ncbi:MAG TPA: flagellar hook-basal body complex protein FliE [Xanthomonadaceae bacterium]|nr:flagellar hook-basal body complex protein FliE [Xanthomonadaceae bacterium]
MGIEAIAALGAAAGPAEAQASMAVPRSDFAAVVGQGVQGVDGTLKNADQLVRALAAGQDVATHDVMISLEEARMQLMLLSEVRNRVVEAYQELSRMQL